MQEQKEYYAFISYKREDEKWAKWLQDKLEHYRFPTNLNGRSDLPKHIRPTFRDVTDLKPGLLAEEINNALRNSEWLIVVCSPRSAKSPWVCKEAQTFIDLGRADHIIPFVIEGIPFSDTTAIECYPEALLNLTGSKELLAANINEMGRDAAAIKVVARMFNLRFDTLWQRYERDKKRKRNWLISAAITSFLFVSGIAYWLFWQNMQIQEANWKMMENQAKAVAEKANQLTNDGDSYTARLLALAVLPKDLERPDRPYTIEAEGALRKACQYHNTILGRHLSSDVTASFSPDGKSVVSASADKTIRIWNVENGMQIGLLVGHTDYVTSASFSPDGKRIVSSSYDMTIRIWDVETGKQIGKPLKGHTSAVCSASFSPDGKLIVSASNDNTIRIWNAKTGQQIGKPLNGHTSGVLSASFSPDGKLIVSASVDKTIRIWDTESGQQIGKPLEGHSWHVTSAFFSPDGKRIVSSSYDMTIRIWDVETGKQIDKPLKGHTLLVRSASFSPDGKYIVSAAFDDTIRIWDAESGLQIGEPLEGHTGCVNSAFFSPNGKLIVSASNDFTIRIWDSNIGKQNGLPLEGSNIGSMRIVSFSHDCNRLVSYVEPNRLIIWDTKTGRQIGKPIEMETVGWECYSTISPDGKYVVSADTVIKIWDVQTGQLVGKPLDGYPGRKDSLRISKTIQLVLYDDNSVSFSPDSKRVVSTATNNTMQIWDVETGLRIGKPLEGHTKAVYSAVYSHDGRYIVSASADSTIRIWNAKTGQQIGKPLKGHAAGVSEAIFSYDGNRIVSVSDDNTIRFWNAKTGQQVGNTITVAVATGALSFSHNNKKILTRSAGNIIRIWDVETGQQICQPLEGCNIDKLYGATFSPDDKHIIVVADGSIIVWEFPPLQQLIDETRERFKDRPLTTEERQKYYLQ